MKKNIIIIIAILISFNSCKQIDDKKAINDNMLLAQEVKATYDAIVDNQDNPEWTENFNSEVFFKTAINKAFSGEVPIYGNAFLGNIKNRELVTSEDIKKRISGEITETDKRY